MMWMRKNSTCTPPCKGGASWDASCNQLNSFAKFNLHPCNFKNRGVQVGKCLNLLGILTCTPAKN